MYQGTQVGVVIPAYNEEQSVARVITDLLQLKNGQQCIIDDLVVCDNNSTDNTFNIAQQAGARVVHESRQGYGYACLCALRALKPVDIIVFIDADHADHPAEVVHLLDKIHTGADLVIGSRALGHAERGALPPHQRFGNYLLTKLINLLWDQQVTDLGPFRAIRWHALQALAMADKTYGWTAEMQIKAIQAGLQLCEIPVSYRRRIGKSKISGTLSGSTKAGIKIFKTISELWWQGYTK